MPRRAIARSSGCQGERSPGRAVARSSDRQGERSPGRAVAKASGCQVERLPRRAIARSSDRQVERSPGRAVARSGGSPRRAEASGSPRRAESSSGSPSRAVRVRSEWAGVCLVLLGHSQPVSQPAATRSPRRRAGGSFPRDAAARASLGAKGSGGSLDHHLLHYITLHYMTLH